MKVKGKGKKKTQQVDKHLRGSTDIEKGNESKRKKLTLVYHTVYFQLSQLQSLFEFQASFVLQLTPSQSARR